MSGHKTVDTNSAAPIPVVSCVIVNDDRVLLLKRRYFPGEGKWALPAGHVDPGEGAEACIVREVREETGLEIDPDRLRFMQSGGRALPDGRSFLAIIFETTVDTDAVELDHESLEFAWVPLESAALDAMDWAFENHRAAVLSRC